MGGFFVDFEAVRTVSSEYDAPRRLFEKWDLENGVINRRLKAEADEKDRWGAASFFLMWRGDGVPGGTHPLDSGRRLRCHFERALTARPSTSRRGDGVARASRGVLGTGVAALARRRLFATDARERPRRFAKPHRRVTRAGATTRPTRSSPTTPLERPRRTMRNY